MDALLVNGTSVAACLEDVDNLARTGAEDGFRLDIAVPDELPMADCDPIGLRDALLNLVFNARDAMPSAGVSIVVTSQRHRRRKRAIEIRVVDDGVGMAPVTLAAAIEPFFTTKATGLGGLGLPLVAHFAKESRGRLEITSAPGRGTTVLLRLPAVGARP
jgi:signal transduction histidine kinase